MVGNVSPGRRCGNRGDGAPDLRRSIHRLLPFKA